MAEGLTPSEACRFDALTAPADERGCRLWLGVCSGFGHGQFHLRGKTVGAHKVAWRRANGWAEIPRGLVVRHFDCNRASCVEGSHLRLGTQADNVADMIDAGRAVVGEDHYAAKLTDEKVRWARDNYEMGDWSIVGLARHCGVTDMVMRDVLVGRSWRHITGGVPVRPPKTPRITADEAELILALRAEGWTQQAIADHLGRSLAPVLRVLYAAGIKQERPGRVRV